MTYSVIDDALRLFIRLARIAGWVILTLAAAPVAFILLQSLWAGSGPTTSREHIPLDGFLAFVPAARLWYVLRDTLLIGCGAVVGAFLIAMPAAFAILNCRTRVTRALMFAAIAWPLLASPCVIAYAWNLMATQKTWLGLFMSDGLGWSSHAMSPVVAAWVLATWLWPIPAVAVLGAYRLRGHAALRLALLDASPTVAFVRAAVPAMRGILMAAAGVVLLLALNDSTIAPLMLVERWWPTEMISEVTRAAQYHNPTGYLLRQCWPMILVAGVIGIVIWRGLRPLLQERLVTVQDESGAAMPRSRAVLAVAILLTLSVSLLPMVVFLIELGTPRMAVGGMLSMAWQLYCKEASASLMVATLMLVCALLAGLASIPIRSSFSRRWHWWTFAAVTFVILAILPPVVLGQSVIAVFDRGWTTPWTGERTLYDDTPVAWIAGLLLRFGFIPLLLVFAARQMTGDDTAEQASIDGADGPQVLAFVRIPELWRVLLASGLLVGCLTLGELPLSVMISPVRYGGSLSVAVDQQIHFGRYGHVVAISLMLTLPAMVVAAAISAVAIGVSGRSARRH